MTQLLTENIGWKILALLIATILWFGFVGQTEVATSVAAAVQFKNVPPDLEVTSEALDRVFLRLRGPATRLNAEALTQVAVLFDLAQIHSPGERTFTLGPENLLLPAGVHASSVIPAQVRISLDRRASREVAVEVRYAGPPPNGYRVAKQQVTPQKVRIIGPEGRVNPVQAAQTDPIDLSSTVSNTEFRVPVYIPDSHLRFDGAPPVISVRVFMEKIPQ